MENPKLKTAEIVKILENTDKYDDELLFKTAYDCTTQKVGQNVNIRGIVEFSNKCDQNCYYCGIRNANDKIERFTLTKEQILDAAQFAIKNLPGLLLQAGEIKSQQQVDFVCDVIREIKKQANKYSPLKQNFRIIISIGELTKQQYQQLKDVGASRYLLRIETTNPKLFQKVHPRNQKFYDRLQCLQTLKDLNYHVGSGVLIGLPGQTVYDLANDVQFLTQVDMVGMGPYLQADNTPLATIYDEFQVKENLHTDDIFTTVRRMISLCRLTNPKSNISATTAMETMNKQGRILAIRSGSNVVMPVFTPKTNKVQYSLYKGKSDVNSNIQLLNEQIQKSGRYMDLHVSGDPITWKERQQK